MSNKKKTAAEWLLHLPPLFRDAVRESRNEYRLFTKGDWNREQDSLYEMLLWSKEGLSRDHREDPIWDEIYRRIDSGELKEPWKEPKKTAAEWLLYLPPYFRKLVKKSLNKYTNYPGWEKKKISLYEMLFCSKEGLSRDHREAPIWDEMYLRERRGEFDQPWVDTKEEEASPTVIDEVNVYDKVLSPDKISEMAESYLAPSPAPDMFNNPPHYTKEDLECIDAIKASLATYRTDGYAGYLKGTIMAYLWRYEDKKGVQDLRKAKWYLQKLIDHETQV